MSQSFPYGCGFLEVRIVKSRKNRPPFYGILVELLNFKKKQRFRARRLKCLNLSRYGTTWRIFLLAPVSTASEGLTSELHSSPPGIPSDPGNAKWEQKVVWASALTYPFCSRRFTDAPIDLRDRMLQTAPHSTSIRISTAMQHHRIVRQSLGFCH